MKNLLEIHKRKTISKIDIMWDKINYPEIFKDTKYNFSRIVS